MIRIINPNQPMRDLFLSDDRTRVLEYVFMLNHKTKTSYVDVSEEFRELLERCKPTEQSKEVA